MSPSLISSELGMVPFRAWKVGEQRVTQRGDLLEGTYDSTYWCSPELTGGGAGLTELLEAQLAELETRKAFLAEFCSTGGRIEYFVGWFTDKKNTGEVFDWRLLSRLAALQISLSMDIYGGNSPI